jgi:ribosomal protein S19
LVRGVLAKRKVLSFFLFRCSPILPYFFDVGLKVHNGKYLKKARSGELVICRKAGEFAFSRKPYFFPIKKK